MKQIISTILTSFLTSLLVVFLVYNYLPLSWLDKLSVERPLKLGSTITTIQGTDRLTDSRSVINTNFSNLNADKIENSTSSVAAITTLSNLTTVGALVSGSLATGFTLVPVSVGGTASNTISQYRVILGNGTSGFTVATTTGNSGDFLVSNGAGQFPTWQAVTASLGSNYTWTGQHTFNGATTTIKNLGIATSSAAFGSGFSLGYIGFIVSTSTYFGNGVGIGIATQTPNANLQVAGSAIFKDASTTSLYVSGACLGCPGAYTGSSTAQQIVSGSKTCTSCIPTNANTIIIQYSKTNSLAAGTLTLTRTGLTLGEIADSGGATTDYDANFSWSTNDLIVTEATDDNADSVLTYTAYYYK